MCRFLNSPQACGNPELMHEHLLEKVFDLCVRQRKAREP